MPEGDITAKVPKVLRPPAGEVYAAVESPRGELGIHLVSDGGATPYRMHLRAPSLYNLAVVDEALAGDLIADAVVIIGSPRHHARGDRPMSPPCAVAVPHRSRCSG